MPETLDRAPGAELATIPGAAVIRRIRRLLIWAGVTALVYGTLVTASKGGCPGGATGDGGYLDANGDPTEVVPQCVQLTLKPSGLVFVFIAVAVLVAISRVLRAGDQASAIRVLDRTAIVIVAVVAAWSVVTLVSFLSIPLDQWDGTEPFFLDGFVFGNVDIVRTTLG
ncbi:hypothetical protein BJ978_000359 [Agromyces terreus]|uniref:Cell division protein FtsK n=1 Tax=Agromyces terreus TaxID=424795 RepID=A0A9X2K9W5_9MICO|nr:hypothetical protein [Agromyces terreus]MCP2369683.1 hypothetical protein [Agromyces terreus]